MDNQLYFVYGSNLNIKDLSSWMSKNGFCNLAQLKKYSSKYVLPDYKPVFNRQSFVRKCGVLSIVPHKGAITPGVIFEVNSSQLAALRNKEGYPNAYLEKEVTVIDYMGNSLKCITYIAENKDCFIETSESYFNIVIEGLKHFELDTRPVERARKNQEPFCINSVFVYGTLMKGQSRESYIIKYRPEVSESAQCSGSLFNLGPYPGLKLEAGSKTLVHGEFHKFSNISEVLNELDLIEEYEGFNLNSLYLRLLTEVRVKTDQTKLAWVYVYNRDTTPNDLIETGSWRTKS